MTRLSPSTDFRPGSKTRRVEAFVTAARAALTWERVWPALWPATGIAGLFIAAALFGLPDVPAVAAACAGARGLHHRDGVVALLQSGEFPPSQLAGWRAPCRARLDARPSSDLRRRRCVECRSGRRLGASVVGRASQPPPRGFQDAASVHPAFRSREARSARAALCCAAADRGGCVLREHGLAQSTACRVRPGHERSGQRLHRRVDRSATLYRRAAGVSDRQPHDQRADRLNREPARTRRESRTVALRRRRIVQRRSGRIRRDRAHHRRHDRARAQQRAHRRRLVSARLARRQADGRVRFQPRAHGARRAQDRLHRGRRLRCRRGQGADQAAWPLRKDADRRSAARRCLSKDAVADELS